MKLVSKCLFVSLLGLSVAAFSADREKYHIVNNTDFSVTSKLNDKKCSSVALGKKDGVTPKHDKKDITQYQASVGCSDNQTNCKADIYITEDCSGEKIASVTIDVKNGVKPDTKVIYNSAFSLEAHGFYIELNGGPAAP